MKRNQEKGSIFILTVCIFVFVSIIAINFTDITMVDTVRVKRNINQAHAELISLSGIELLKGYILEFQDDFEHKVANKSDSYFFPNTVSMLGGTTKLDISFFDEENTELSLNEVSDGTNLDFNKIKKIELISNSSFKNESKTLKGIMEIYDDNSSSNVFEEFHAFFSETGSNQWQYPDHKILENLKEPDIPVATINEGDLKVNGNKTVTKQLLPEEVYSYDDISSNGSSVLNFELLGEENEFHKVIVDNFDSNASINIIGAGTLVFYVSDEFSLNSVAFINDPEDLLIILRENATFKLSGGVPTDFNGFVYGAYPNTHIEFNGSNTAIGGFISNTYKESGGNLNLNYSPNANIDLLDGIGIGTVSDYKMRFKGFE